MIKLRLPLMMMLALTVQVAAADVSGTWDVFLKADWTSIPALACKVSQNGQQFTGSCMPPGTSTRDAADLIGGKVEGNRVTWEMRVITPDGETWTYALTGTLDPKETMIEGSFILSGAQSKGGRGSFTAKKR